ncbi:DUF397 domain-containing protein [Yinghuangia aomiensis]|uniref:DUF397 domain-containing protein n=1 Tax=Yinghuangia aomiensis TaxID=676205 RepID=A0ABP9IC69_9ACTN
MTTPTPMTRIWRKSSHSNQQGGNCVEVAPLRRLRLPAWRKSSYSNQQGGDCVEVAPAASTIAVRDSKDPLRGELALATPAWTAFTARLVRG